MPLASLVAESLIVPFNVKLRRATVADDGTLPGGSSVHVEPLMPMSQLQVSGEREDAKDGGRVRSERRAQRCEYSRQLGFACS